MKITPQTAKIVEPRDTLVVRDARPASEGVPMRTVAWPWPSSLAGMARTRVFSDSKTGAFPPEAADKARALEVVGPWLVRLDARGQSEEIYFPAPRDAVFMPSEEKPNSVLRLGLGPIRLAANEATDLANCATVGFIDPKCPKGKSVPRPPAFWSYTALKAWLTMGDRKRDVLPKDWAEGLAPLVRERRTHVTIAPETGTATDGMLFSVEALRFTPSQRADAPWNAPRYALGFACDAKLDEGPVFLGGERRVSSLRTPTGKAFPEAFDLTKGHKGPLRIVLLTPGVFAAGHRPSEQALAKLGARLIAWAVDRPQAISGWDFDKQEPKRSRRVAPAGSVYWLEVEGDPITWAAAHQLSTLADDPQDARDGFGLFAVGVG